MSEIIKKKKMRKGKKKRCVTRKQGVGEEGLNRRIFEGEYNFILYMEELDFYKI